MNPNSNYDENDSDNNSELSETEERNLESIISIFPKRDLRKEVENADKSTFEKIKQLLSCPICLEIFKEPVFVKECMHRFCKGCIEKIIRGNHKNCPTCRKSIGSKRELKPDNAAVEMSKQRHLFSCILTGFYSRSDIHKPQGIFRKGKRAWACNFTENI